MRDVLLLIHVYYNRSPFFFQDAAGRTLATSSCELHRLSGKYNLVVSTMVVLGDYDWSTSLVTTIAP